MARRAQRERPFSAGLLLFALLLSAAADPTDLVHALHGHSAPMILPLVLSRANSSWHRSLDLSSHWRRRRQLQRAAEGEGDIANAHMRLYDDLLTNGYYTTRLYIGTPPQVFALIVDTGSTVTYVPCSTCEQCGNHQDPRFQPELSNTYQPLKCNADCTCDKQNNQCTYERQYAEMSSSSGVLGIDVVSFGNESILKPQHAIFGCENMETGDLFSQHADGIMGLGRGQLSIMDQLVDKGVITDSFSLCYGGMDLGGGAMVLGGISSPPSMVFSRSDPIRSPYYNIELKEVHVSGIPLKLNPRIFDGKHGTVLDSGTTYAYLPEAAFVAFRDAVMKHVLSLKQIRGPDPTYKDICFAGAGSDVGQLSRTFPDVDLIFKNGQKLSISPENYLFRHSKVPGAYCLGIFQNGNDPTTLLGGILVRNTLVTYDRENQRIGFWKTNCSELWKRLYSPGAPSPAPTKPDIQDSSTRPAMTPMLAPAPCPSGSQNYSLPEHFPIRLITFDIFININRSDMVNHTAEVTELIAHELRVNMSQVQLTSVSSEGSGSLLRWAIYPEGTNHFISNVTATAIISRLTEHRVHLPKKFGSYQLVDWKVEPLSKRTWWQKHIWALVFGVSAVVMVSFSTFFLWYFWRRWHGPRTYRPVDAPVPEHELQPL